MTFQLTPMQVKYLESMNERKKEHMSDILILDDINAHLRSLAPHVRERLTSTLLRRAVTEIKQLRAENATTVEGSDK